MSPSDATSDWTVGRHDAQHRCFGYKSRNVSGVQLLMFVTLLDVLGFSQLFCQWRVSTRLLVTVQTFCPSLLDSESQRVTSQRTRANASLS